MYERTRAIEDLSFAIEQAWKALHHTSLTHALYTDRLNGLSVLYSHLFDRSRQLGDISLAIRFSKEALSLTDPKAEHKSSFLNNLASHLTKRFVVKADLVDAVQAIYCEDEALLISPTSSSRPAYWVNISQVLHAVYEKSQDRCLLETAVLVLDHALSETPDHHPLRPKVLSSLAAKYMELGGYDEPIDQQRRVYWTLALNLLLEAWKSDLADPYKRIQLAHLVSDVYLALEKWSDAGEILAEAYKLLPLVTSRALELGDQQDLISRVPGLIGTLAIIVLEIFDDPDRSLEYLEGGRGLIQSGYLQHDADLDRLEAIDDRFAQLAGQFRSLQQILTGPTASLAKDGMSLAQRKRQIEQDFQHVLDEIRDVSGFTQFQRPLSIDQIKEAAAGRIIIVINPTRLGSDAFIVTSNAVLPFNFDSLQFNDAEKHIRNFRVRILAAKPNKQNELLRETLTWLWDCVAFPLFQYMRLKPRGGSPRLPKITWICTGVLSNAPIHAAANYASKDATQRVSEYCLSTFASTIRTISVSQNTANLTKMPVSMMGIEMKTTPGRKRALGRLDEEFANIRNSLPRDSSYVRLQQPSADEVVAALPSAQIVHFSCHGISDAVDPSQSRLLLQRVITGGISDGAGMTVGVAADSAKEEVILDPLTVGRVIRLRLPSAMLAVLSACSSAVNDNAQLADETLHIAAMMQLAGFRHVIGTLWEAKNDACVDFATYFYEALFKDGGEPGQVSKERNWTDRISEAYHHSLCLLQAKYWMMPLTWAPFVYFG
jgi:tetratricopeptide (TPR) repeat protein